MRTWLVLTLWLGEVALVDTGLQSFVEQRVELGLGCDGDLVVGLDVLLDGLSAVDTSERGQGDEATTWSRQMGLELTWNRFAP
jgi:hypothetical protein